MFSIDVTCVLLFWEIKLSGGNRLASCVYVCVAKIDSFFHERYLVVFACKAVFAH